MEKKFKALNRVLIVYKKSSYEAHVMDEKDRNYLKLLKERNPAIRKSKSIHDTHRDTFETVKKRLVGDVSRPLIRMAKGEEPTLVSLYESRLPLYERADFALDTSRMSPEEAAEKIIHALDQ